MNLDFFQLESCRAQVISVCIDRLSVGNASDPRKKAIQLLGQRRTAREVAKAYPSAWAENAREFASGICFIGKRAEGAFANDYVERFVRERQAFGVTVLKSDQ
jgi:hypothetical protein